MRRLALALALLLAAPPVTAQTTTPFACEEVALDMAACGTPPDLALCPTLCMDATNPTPETCAPLPLPELPTLNRTAPAQGILRQAFVTGGSYIGATISLVSLNANADTVFAKARDQLCKAPSSPTPPTPVPPPTGGDGDSPPVVVIGGGLIGPNPGLVGPNPGLVGVTPRFR